MLPGWERLKDMKFQKHETICFQFQSRYKFVMLGS